MLPLLVLVLVFSLFMSSSCNVPTEPLNRIKYNVHAMLSSASRIQRVFVASVDSGTIWIGGANVEINGVKLSKIGGAYILDSIGFVRPGRIYKLQIYIINDLITGETIVPGDFEIITPREYVEIKGKNADTIDINLEWTKSEGASFYVVEILAPPVEFPQGSGVYYRRTIATFLSESEKANVKINTERYGAGIYTVRVCAVDQNYKEYHFSKQRVPSAGLTNSYGYFASMVVDSIIVNLQK